MNWNHRTPLEYYQEALAKLLDMGFKPIGVSQMECEDVFIFETPEEAIRAYHLFERDQSEKWIGEISGWWYGKSAFEEAVKQYEAEWGTKVLTYWL
jgi:hypothetical protein